MGVGTIELCDMDTVEEANMGAQGYRPDQVGQAKVEATSQDIAAINPECDRYVYPDAYKEGFRLSSYTAVFACVDCMAARTLLAKRCFEEDVPMIDTRMSGLIAQAYYMNPDEDSFGKYSSTLFSNEDAYPEPCTAKSVIFTSSIIAGLGVSLWAQSLQSPPPYPFLSLSLVDYRLEPILLESSAAPQDPEPQPSADTAEEVPQVAI